MGRPISGKHAIEVAVFAVTFEKNFTKPSVDALLTLKELLKDRYPIFSETTAVNVQLGPGGMSEQTSSRSGVSLQKAGSDGKPEWALRADGNAIVVLRFNYDRWGVEAPAALTDMATVIRIVADDTNPVQHLSLQVVDRFVGIPMDSYKINQVFDPKSKYLTKHIVNNSGPLWHLHQGWFESIEGKTKQLNVLNLSTNDTPSGITTTIDHLSRHIFNNPRSTTEVSDEKILQEIFDILHLKNKEIVIDLINTTQCKAIKLCMQK